MDFSETIAASDLKVNRSSYLIEYMKVCEYSRSRSFLDDLNQFFYEAFQVQGNENLMT